MKVLSLFDGISACHLALTRAGFEVDNYYTSEVDKYATQISEKHYPDAIRLGDITNWQEWDIDWSSIDLVTGGFPCQAWSIAGKQLGDKDERGMLFWTMLDVMKTVLAANPKALFLIENVKMKREFEEYITYHTVQALGHVEKHLINSALVSAQNRNRYYWTNIKGITQPEDKGLVLADVIQNGGVDREKSHCLDANYYKGGNLKSYFEKNRRQLVFENKLIVPEATKKGYVEIEPGQCVNLTFPNSKTRRGRKMAGKSNCLTAANHEYSHWNGHSYRKLTPVECERLQTFPDGWTDGVSNTQRYKTLGNAWTVDVVAHIFSFMKRGTFTLEKGLFLPAGAQLPLDLFEQISELAVS